MTLTETRWKLDGAREEDLAEITRLLIELYRAEAPWSVPKDETGLATVLLAGLRDQGTELLETSLVMRDQENPTKLAGYVAMSPDHRPRQPLFNNRYVRAAAGLLGPLAGMRVLWHQYRMMGLLCSPLVPGAAQMHSLIVDPVHRGSGLAVHLVKGVEELAVAHNQSSVILFVFAGNPVEPFYQRLGYTRVPLPRPRFPLPQAGIAMQRPLNPAACQEPLNQNATKQKEEER